MKFQFIAMKRKVYEVATTYKSGSFEMIWGRISIIVAVIPLIFRLLYVCVAIICHTASVERGFSLHQQFKSVKASRLRVLTVDALMRVKLLSPEIEESGEYDDLVAKAVSMLGSEEESLFRNRQPPLLMRDLNEQVNGIMMPLVAIVVLGAG